MTSKRISVKVSLRLLPFGCNLKREFWDCQFWGIGECWSVRICTKFESPPTISQYLPIQGFALSADNRIINYLHSISPLTWPEFQCEAMPPSPPIRPPVSFPFDVSIHTKGLFCTVWPQYTSLHEFTTDRAIGISRLC